MKWPHSVTVGYENAGREWAWWEADLMPPLLQIGQLRLKEVNDLVQDLVNVKAGMPAGFSSTRACRLLSDPRPECVGSSGVL